MQNYPKKCRWGFLSTAGIAKKNWQAIWHSGNGKVVAVASRNISAARTFIDGCQREYPWAQVPDAVSGYQNILDRDDIDAVYIPLPTAIRAEWVERALEAGKYVLAEKPAGIDASVVERFRRLAQKNGVQYMDGVMFMHSRRLEALRDVLNNSAQLGQLRRIASQFSFCGDEAFRKSNIRVDSRLEPHGCLGDLGWYCIRMALWIMDGEMPERVIGRRTESLQGEGSPESVPGTFVGELYFSKGVTSSFYCSFTTHHQQWTHISGDRGCIWIDDFVLPFFGFGVEFQLAQNDFQVSGCQFNMVRRDTTQSVPEYANNHPTSQEANLMRTMGDLVLSRTRDDRWETLALNTQRVLDALWKSSKTNGEITGL